MPRAIVQRWQLTCMISQCCVPTDHRIGNQSTLARCMAGLSRPSSGRIKFEGNDIWNLHGRDWRAYRRQVQPIFQDPFSSLDPRWSAERTIREALDAFGIGDGSARQARVAELMEQVGLPYALRGRRPYELSGGQCQRVGIAAALAAGPSVLVADEPGVLTGCLGARSDPESAGAPAARPASVAGDDHA